MTPRIIMILSIMAKNKKTKYYVHPIDRLDPDLSKQKKDENKLWKFGK